MKQIILAIKVFAILTLCVFVGTACTSRKKAGADQRLQTLRDSLEKVTMSADERQKQAEWEQHIAACKAFIETFYNGLEKSGYDNDYVKQYVTPNAAQWLKEMYDYDCDGGDCMATWLFAYDITDPGDLKERTIAPIDDNTYKVVNAYTGAAEGDYEYGVKLGLVKEGDTFKIDSIESVK